jgi:hypothetical protein
VGEGVVVVRGSHVCVGRGEGKEVGSAVMDIVCF